MSINVQVVSNQLEFQKPGNQSRSVLGRIRLLQTCLDSHTAAIVAVGQPAECHPAAPSQRWSGTAHLPHALCPQ